MANRFWTTLGTTGGTGNWSDTQNWSLLSGGVAGASVPGAADGARFDGASGSGTATLDISPVIESLSFSGTGTFAGTFAFGTNTVTLNSTGTIFVGTTTMTVTGTPQIICTNSSATSRTISPAAVTEANSISFRITAGTGTLSLTAGGYRDLDFTDGTNPTGYAGALGNTTITIYGNFKASTGMTRSAGATTYTFAATSGTKTINTAGVTFDNAFTFNGVGGTWQLQDALTSGSTRTCTLTAGTLDLNGYTLTTGIFSSSNSNTRVLAFGTGNITLTGVNTTIFNTTTVTGMTITGTPVVNCTATTGTSVQTRIFISGPHGESQAISVNINPGTSAVDIFRLATNSGAFKDVTFSSTFTGTLQISNSVIIYGNFDSGGTTAYTGPTVITFAATSGTKTIKISGLTIDSPVTFNGIGGTWAMQDALTLGATRALTMTNGTLQLKAGTTNTVGSFVTTGTTLKYLQSTIPGTQATISDASGTDTVTYLSIKDSNATGGAAWDANDATNVDAGNNTGWFFAPTPSVSNEIEIRLRSFTQPRRF